MTIVDFIKENTVPKLFQRSVIDYNRKKGNININYNSENDLIENMDDRNSSPAVFVILFCLSSLLLSSIGIYSQYILVKCYCGDFLVYLFVFTMLMTFPYLTIPFLFYKRFSDGDCGDIFEKL